MGNGVLGVLGASRPFKYTRLAALFGGLGWKASLVSAHSIANREAPRAGHASMERARVAERAGGERIGEREIGEYEWAWDARSGGMVGMYVCMDGMNSILCVRFAVQRTWEHHRVRFGWGGRYISLYPPISIAIFRDSNSNNIQYKLQYAGSLFPLTRCDPAGGLTGSTASTLLYVVPLSSAPLSAKFYGDGRYRIQYLRMWSIAQPRFSPSRL